jgi:hypothetical protein
LHLLLNRLEVLFGLKSKATFSEFATAKDLEEASAGEKRRGDLKQQVWGNEIPDSCAPGENYFYNFIELGVCLIIYNLLKVSR